MTAMVVRRAEGVVGLIPVKDIGVQGEMAMNSGKGIDARKVIPSKCTP